MSPRLVNLELEAFRGFSSPQSVDLDADIILVRGDNGSGKTSLTDGILWVLTGALPHITERAKGLRPTHDPIQNRYADGPSRVALTVRDDSGTWRFERVGSARDSTLTAELNGQSFDGDAGLTNAFGEDTAESLRTAVTTWGILRQDAVRSVLDTGGAALHARMSSVIGLADVTRFREACRTASKKLAQERRQSDAVHASSIRSRIAARQALDGFRSASAGSSKLSLQERIRAMALAIRADIEIDATGIEDLQGVIAVGQEISSLIELFTVAADAHDASVRAAAAVKSESARLEVELGAVEAQAKELGRLTSDTQRLAEAALQLLGERCPVCGQEIDEGVVRAKLEQDLQQNAARMIAATEARNSVSTIKQRLIDAQTAEARRGQAAAHLARVASELEAALESSKHVKLQAGMPEPKSFRPLAHRLEELRSALRRLHAEASAQSEVEESRHQAAAAAAVSEENRARAALERVTAREDSIQNLEKAAQRAEERIVSNWLRQLEPSFSEVFDRLSPHPTFSELRARQDIYYNRNQIVPEVVDPIRGISANPLLVYSEGQLNTVALSYFLGLALNAPSASLGFMVLDDPLQAMDVLAVLGFADLCRRLRRERQLLITTHDRRYADLLARKLAPREPADTTITHEIEGWSEDGPHISSRREEFQSGKVASVSDVS